jgi:dipeptidyl aminopeptidase/acylaminoacyl peptidase
MNKLWLAGSAVAVIALAAFVSAVRAARSELASLEPTPHVVIRPGAEAWLDAAKDVRLRTPKGVVLAGWLLGTVNGAAVMLVTGSGTDRTQLLPEARILSDAGYGVLMFDLPGSGESGGQKRRGDDLDFLRIAVDRLASEPGVRAIGAYGFSTGAALLAEAAAQDARIQAAVLAGCYTDTDSHIRDDYRRWGPLTGVPAIWAAKWAGLVPLQPFAVVPRIAPRALFFIAGDADPTVPFHSSERLYAVASEPKALWIVHGAVHGDYARSAGADYARKLVAFFDRALLGRNGSP